MPRRVDAQSVSSAWVFPRPAAGARGIGCGASAGRRSTGRANPQLIERHPTFGYRRLWALLRYEQGIAVNRKAVYRVLKLKG